LDIRNPRVDKKPRFALGDAPMVAGARYDLISILAKRVTLVTSEPIK
jgi:hypothetical protein